jgi:hypothetical protein
VSFKFFSVVCLVMPTVIGLAASVISRRRRSLPLISRVPAVRSMYLVGLAATLYPTLLVGSIWFDKYPVFTWIMRTLLAFFVAAIVAYAIKGRRLIRTVRSLNGAACLTCVYPFDAQSGICPECGTHYNLDDAIEQWRQEQVLEDAVPTRSNRNQSH